MREINRGNELDSWKSKLVEEKGKSYKRISYT